MAYIWQRWMPAAFRAAGLTVVEVDGWENRGRPASTGSYNPDQGVTNHHTGSTSSVLNPHPTLQLLIKGRPDLPGPLAPWSVAYDATVYVLAAGRCNHAGKIGKPFPGTFIGQDGNAIFMGDEIDTNGTQQMPPEQRHAVDVTNAVYLEHFGLPVIRLHRHEDISGTGKWDLGGVSTASLRATAHITEKDWFDMADRDDLREVVDNAIKAATPAIAEAAARQVMARQVTHVTPDGKTSNVSVGTILRWVNQRGQRIEKKVDALDDAGKAPGA